MKKKYIVLLVMGVMLFCIIAAADQLCTHVKTELGRAYQYEQREAGHVKTTIVTTYCAECNATGYETSQTFEGHNFVWTGHLHQGKRWHVSYYTCSACGYQTAEGYYCEGPPCAIMMSLPHAHESE